MQLQRIKRCIFEIRDQKVILDYDLAELYGVSTKALKQAVRRNLSRFPQDFMFRISKREFESLRSQIVTSNRGGTRYMPYAFTEQGVAMLSSVLNSRNAIKINIEIMRAFVLMRKYALTNEKLSVKLKRLERKFNRRFRNIGEALTYLLQQNKIQQSQSVRRRIGFKA